MILSPSQLATYAYGAGFRGQDLVKAVAIALAESGGDTTAHNTKGEDSRGPWQINVGPGAHTQWLSQNLFDPAINAARAFDLFTANHGFNDWTTYTGGAYLGHIPEALAGVAAIGVGAVGSAGQSGDVGAQASAGVAPGVNAQASAGTGPGIHVPAKCTSILGQEVCSPAIDINLPSFPDVGNIPGAISSAAKGLAETAQGIIGPGVAAISNVNQIAALIGNPRIYTGLAMVLIGGALVLLGLVLFGVSLIPNAKPVIPIPV